MHRGPFFMGTLAGMGVNIIAVAWLVFAIVFFSFPYEMPVKGILSLLPWTEYGSNTSRSIEYELHLRVRRRIPRHRTRMVDHRRPEVLEEYAEGKAGGGECRAGNAGRHG